MLRLSFAALLLCSFASPVCALAEVWGATTAHAWPTSSAYQGFDAGGPFTRGVAGDFTKDGVVDACVLEDHLAVLAVAPSRYSAFVRLPVLANDIASLPADEGAVLQDTILVVNADGLLRASFDSVDMDSSRRSASPAARGTARGSCAWGTSTDHPATTSWASRATGSRCARSCGTATRTARPELQHVEHDPRDRDPRVGRRRGELALRTSAGLQVRELSGTSILSTPHAASGGAIAAVRVPGHPRDLLAWAAATPGQQALFVIERS